jgi:hypothetical protein
MFENLEHLLPADPENGQIFILDDDTPIGSSTFICLKNKDGMYIGDTETIIKIPNKSNKYYTGRVRALIPLEEEQIIHIIGFTKAFKSLKFVDDMGWVGHEYHNKEEILIDNLFVVNFIKLAINFKDQYIYETMCLTKIKGENQ